MENANRQLAKALPRYGRPRCEVDLPPWMAQLEQVQIAARKNEAYKQWLKESYRQRRRVEMMEKIKVAVAGVVLVVVSLATAIVR